MLYVPIFLQMRANLSPQNSKLRQGNWAYQCVWWWHFHKKIRNEISEWKQDRLSSIHQLFCMPSCKLTCSRVQFLVFGRQIRQIRFCWVKLSNIRHTLHGVVTGITGSLKNILKSYIIMELSSFYPFSGLFRNLRLPLTKSTERTPGIDCRKTSSTKHGLRRRLISMKPNF